MLNYITYVCRTVCVRCTFCGAWCPAAGLPVSVCSKAEISVVLTPATPGDCTPSEPHPSSPPAAAQVYTPPAQTLLVRHCVSSHKKQRCVTRVITWSRSRAENTTRPLSSPEKSFIPFVLQVKDVTEPLWRPTTSKRLSCTKTHSCATAVGRQVAYCSDSGRFSYLFVATRKWGHQLEDCNPT